MNLIAIIISLPIVAVLLKNSAAAEEGAGSPPLFGYHDSPIVLGTSPKKEEEGGDGPVSPAEGDPRRRGSIWVDLDKRQRQKQIRYLLRSKTGKWEELQRTGLDADAGGGRWHANGTVKVVIHGFSPPVFAKREQSIRKMHIFEIGDAYGTRRLNYNVIIVDWTSLSSEPLHKYYEAAVGTAYAAEDVAEFLSRLKSLGLISSWETVHLVGFSLGAHVAGFAGALIHRANDGVKLGRITGIDPAGPLFEENDRFFGNLTRPLDSNDANFVDVIHCNMGSVLTFAFAPLALWSNPEMRTFICSADGGESQNGCTKLQDQLEACSHIKCPWIFAQSITNYFLSCPCQSWARLKNGTCSCSRGDGFEMAMGEQCSKRALGTYYRLM